MRIAIIGTSGFIGSALLTEALMRGHQVTGLVRHLERLDAHLRLTAKLCNAYRCIRWSMPAAG
ncbi:NAD-dependent epimerase/dehydratase family protein [Pseudomonas sp. NPDC089569]|uniref:NAD-dependent epimerase/dehydratase family protein n=1 Tax=Pseudomonas sp. NPDC089569 TaxID=3390722 RepID=UPI003D0235DD